MTTKRQQQEAAGRWLRQAREKRGFRTAGALAQRMGVSTSLISRYETGLSAVSDERAEQLAEALGMSLIDVRRGLMLWVPPGGVDAEEPDRPSTDDLLDEHERILDEISASLPDRNQQQVEAAKKIIRLAVETSTTNEGPPLESNGTSTAPRPDRR